MQPRKMQQIVLAAIIILGGCATTSTPTGKSDPMLAKLEEKRRAIAARETQCVDEVLNRSRDEMARIAATPDASIESRTRKENDERDHDISQCHASADQADGEISAQERSEYEREAQQERDRASFMAILTTSLKH